MTKFTVFSFTKKVKHVFSNTRSISCFCLIAILITSIVTPEISISSGYVNKVYAEENSNNSTFNVNSTSPLNAKTTNYTLPLAPITLTNSTINANSSSTIIQTNFTTSANVTSVANFTGNALEKSDILLQHNDIEINKPVTWLQTITLQNQTNKISVEIPDDAKILNIESDGKNIDLSKNVTTVSTVSNNQSTSAISLNQVPGIVENSKLMKLLLINKTANQYQIQFQTDAPHTIEKIQSSSELFSKEITVTDDSSLNYTNIKSYSSIPEDLVSKGIPFHLYWLINGTYFDVTNESKLQVTLVDTNNNGISDQMQWIVPHLSGQTFLIAASNAPDGTFHSPSGVAVDSTGTIYVVDRGNNRVEAFNSTGTFQSKFGAPGFDPDGSGPLQAPPATFDNPTGIAVDKIGNTYVADTINNRIEVFNSSGKIRAQFGTLGLDPDGPGPLQAPNGTFQHPVGIVTDGTGHIFVVDSNNNRVERFGPTGIFQLAFGTFGSDPDGPGPLQAPNGTFNNPTGVAVDNSGNIYVVDSGNNRVEKFSSTGTFQLAFGTFGSDPDGPGPLQAPNGTFNSPTGIAADNSSNVYVSDSGNNRVQVFSSSGIFKFMFGSFGVDPNAPLPLPPAAGIALDNLGNIYVTNSSSSRIAVFNSSGLFKSKFGSFGFDPDGPGPLQAPNGTFNTPTYDAVDSTNNIYVSDSANNRVEVFLPSGTFKSKFGTTGSDPDGPGPLQAPNGTFNSPQGIAVDSSSNIYVVDSKNNRVEKFSSTGTFQLAFGTFGSDPDGPGPLQAPNGTFNNPTGVAADNSGNVYVAGTGNSRIQVFSSSGIFKSKFGDFATFSNPTGIIATDNLGNIYVSDTGNSRIQKFDSTGHLIYAIVTLREGATGSVVLPSGITAMETLPAGISGTITFKNTNASSQTGNSSIAYKFLQATDIPLSNGASCSLGCVLSFVVTQSQLDAGGFVSQKLTIFHDLNNDNDFKDAGEQLNTTVVQGPVGVFTASTTTNSNSPFALGMVSNIFSPSLNDSLAMSDSVNANSTSNIHLFSKSINETLGMSDSVNANSTSNIHVFSKSINDSLVMSDSLIVTLNSTTVTSNQTPIPHAGDGPHYHPILNGISFSTTQNLNGKEVEFGGRLASANSTSIFETGKSIELNLLLEEAQGAETISHVALYANLPSSASGIPDSDTHITYDKYDGNEITDPNGFFSNVTITTSKIDASHLQVTFDITFAKEMKKSDIIVRVWTITKSSYDTRIPSAFAVVPPKILQPVEITNQTQRTTQMIKNNTSELSSISGQPITQSSQIGTMDMLSKIKDWGGYSSNPITDSELLSYFGITGKSIPHWIEKIPRMVIDGNLTPQEFLDVLKYLASIGVIK